VNLAFRCGKKGYNLSDPVGMDEHNKKSSGNNNQDQADTKTGAGNDPAHSLFHRNKK
jgi:hypothetical protein